ncbi:MAG TPA: DUF4239 domain-containing protein [Polyangia bacterium]
MLELAFFTILGLLFAGMLGMQIAGHRFASRRARDDPFATSEGTAAIEAALYALLGLLVGFTFAGAQDRLTTRRVLIVDEANAVGTAYLRLDLLPPEDQPVLRDDMRRYVDARLAFYDKLLDLRVARADKQRCDELQQALWKHAVAASGKVADSRAALLVLQSLNQMFDLAGARYAALRNHTPVAIFIQLVFIALTCAFFAGIGMAKRRRPSFLHMIMFAGVIAITAYVILNLEFPRVGFVRMRLFDVLLREQRAAMG